MFNGVEYVREVCRKRGIPISQLEKDCGFANGYLNPKKLKKIPYDRAVLIADYLKLSATYIVSGEDPGNKRVISDDDLKFALWGDADNISDADLEDVRRYAAYVAERNKNR